MNIYTNYDIDYDNYDKKLFVKVVSENNKFLGILMENNELILEVHYNKNSEEFILLKGSLGDKLSSSEFNNVEKVERVLEVFNNKLWDYFNPPQNKTKLLP